MQIKAIEDVLGKPLFVRNTRNVALTDDGRMLTDYGRQMLALRERPGRRWCGRRFAAA